MASPTSSGSASPRSSSELFITEKPPKKRIRNISLPEASHSPRPPSPPSRELEVGRDVIKKGPVPPLELKKLGSSPQNVSLSSRPEPNTPNPSPSFFKKKERSLSLLGLPFPFSHHRSEPSIVLSEPAKVSFSCPASPKINLEDILTLSIKIRVFLEDTLSPELAQVLAQISLDQYAFLSPSALELAISLHQANLLGPLFRSIESLLADEKSPISDRQREKILETALKMIPYPPIEDLLADYRSLIERIILLGENRPQSPKSPKYYGLVKEAKDAINFHLSEKPCFEELAKKKLEQIFNFLQDPGDQEFFQLLHDQYPESPIRWQEIFISTVQAYVCPLSPAIALSSNEQIPFIELTLQILLSSEFQSAFKAPQMRDIAERILHAIPSISTHLNFLKKTALTLITIPPISLQELQFLLFWLQSDLTKSEKKGDSAKPEEVLDPTVDLVVGTRQYDPEGKLYQFAIGKFLFLAQRADHEIEVLARWIHFIHCWRQAPANHELIASPFFKFLDKKMMRALSGCKELKIRLEPPFLVEFSHLDLKCESYSPNGFSFHEEEELDLKSSLANKPHPIWSSPSAVKDLSDAMVFYPLPVYQKIGTFDLVTNSKTPAKSIQQIATRSLQITRFCISEILGALFASGFLSIKPALTIVKILLQVEQDLISQGAFEPAFALHCAFAHPSLLRLSRALFQEEESRHQFEKFEEIFNLTGNIHKLRELQDKRLGTFSSLAVLLKDLTSLKEIHPFSEDGSVQIEQWKKTGFLLNQFVCQKSDFIKQCLSKKEGLRIQENLLKAFKAQPSRRDAPEWDEAQQTRSYKVRPEGSDEYCGAPLPKEKKHLFDL